MDQPATRLSSPEGSKVTRGLLSAGIVAPIFFVAAYLVAGVARPGYSPVHQAISDLGVGSNAQVFDAAIVITGLLFVTFAVGFARSQSSVLSPAWLWVSGVLLALHGLGLAVAGVFSEAPATVAIHWLVGADLGFFGPVAAFLVVGLLWRHHSPFGPWAIFTLLLAILTLVVIAVTFWVFTPGTWLAKDHLGGIMERVLLLTIEVWYVVVAWHLLVTAGTTERAALEASARLDSASAAR